MATRKYAQSPLAKARKAVGLTQTDACIKLGFKNKQHLSSIETGQVLASPETMKAMSELYEISPLKVLRLAVDTFESGTVMTKHRRRQLKLAGSRQK